jgi:hypothetical protein
MILGLSLNSCPVSLLSIYLAPETGTSDRPMRTATKLRKLWPCKNIVMYNLKLHGPIARFNFSKWHFQPVLDTKPDPEWILSSAKIWVKLKRYMNTQNRYWSIYNPHLLHKILLICNVDILISCLLTCQLFLLY